jgi:hypothetical protein
LSPVPECFELSARFHTLHVYEIRGLTFTAATMPPRSGIIGTRAYRFTVGSSINAICRSLVNDDFADDEAEWKQERRANPPYLVVHLGATAPYAFSGTHAKIEPATVLNTLKTCAMSSRTGSDPPHLAMPYTQLSSSLANFSWERRAPREGAHANP